MLRFLLEDTVRAWRGFLLFRLSMFSQLRLAAEGPALHAAVVLRRRERMLASELGEFDPAVESGCVRRSDLERVEPHARSNPSRALTAVAKGEGQHAVCHAGQDPDRKLQRAPRVIET